MINPKQPSLVFLQPLLSFFRTFFYISAESYPVMSYKYITNDRARLDVGKNGGKGRLLFW